MDWLDKTIDDYEEKKKKQDDENEIKTIKEKEERQIRKTKTTLKMDLISGLLRRAASKFTARGYEADVKSIGPGVAPGSKPYITCAFLMLTNKHTKIEYKIQFSSTQDFLDILMESFSGVHGVEKQSESFDLEQITEDFVTAKLKLFIEGVFAD